MDIIQSNVLKKMKLKGAHVNYKKDEGVNNHGNKEL